MSLRRPRPIHHHDNDNDNDNDNEHDLGLVHDIGVLTRRRALLFAGLTGASALVACSASTQTESTQAIQPVAETAAECVTAAPQETQGPYPGDGSNGPNVLIESGIVRSDIRSSFGSYSVVAEGVPLTVSLTLQDLTAGCAAGAGMAIYIWQCDRDGRYSLYSDGATDQNYLRGVQVADTAGKVSFTSIFPACYPGRWPHIHFEVFDSLESAVAGENARLTSQIAFPEDSCDLVFGSADGYSAGIANLAQLSLDTDNVFGDGWDAELATVTGDVTGMALSLTIGVGEKTAAAAPPPGGPPPR
ncbi:intradiol ring-cleavage dioxygenase [soil metagenome]